jgi:hypothetical protein
MPQEDSKVHLTFAQIAWFVTILSAIFWTWGDLRVQIAKMEQRAANIEYRVSELERDTHRH